MSKKVEKPHEQPSDSRGSTAGWKSTPKPVWVEGWLDATDKEWLSTNRNNSLAYVGELLGEIGDEYTLSCKFDERSTKYRADLICRVNNHINSGHILVSRGSTPLAALFALAYKHFVKYKGEWRGVVTEDNDEWS